MACDPHYTRTALLLHCNGANNSTTFTDETGKTVSVFGNAKISTVQSKFGGAAAYFDGVYTTNGEHLTVPKTDHFDFQSGDFTLESHVRLASLAGETSLISTSFSTSPYFGIRFRVTSGGALYFGFSTDGGSTLNRTVTSATGLIVANQWYHVAAVRIGSVIRLYIDGVQVGETTGVSGSIYYATRDPVQIGVDFSSHGTPASRYYLNGYLDDIRITKGVARYTADFTPPAAEFPSNQCTISGIVGQVGAPLERLVRLYRRDTGTLVGQTLSSPSTGAYSIQTSVEGEHFALVHDTANGDPFFQNVSLLLPMDGANGSTSFADLSPNKKVVSSVGGAQTSTAQSKFGSSSALLDGVDDFLTVPANTDLDFGSEDFTIEMFVRFVSVPSGGNYAALVTRRDSGTTNISYNLWYGGTEKFYFSFSANGTTQINSATLNTTTPAPNQWYHIALVRSGTNVDIYVDGTKGTAHNIGTSALFTSTSVLRIGAANSTPTFFLNGYIDDLRITKGVARYTANFTPPTAPYPSGAIGGDLNAVIYDRLIPA